MRAAAARARELPLSAVALTGAFALLTADVLSGAHQAELTAVLLIAIVAGLALAWVAKQWPLMISGMLLVVLLIPADGRYTLPGGLPFQLEPYRVVAGLMIAWWICSLLINPDVKARATRFEGPLILLVLATFGSDLANPARVSSVSSNVVKAIWLFICFILFVYMAVSVIRTRALLERLIAVLVSGGAFVGFAAMVQRKEGFNIFDHLHTVLPMFSYNASAALAELSRGGSVRATASAGHPIELSTVMAMLMPLAIYLAISRKQARWWFAGFLLLLGDFAGGSRTGIVGLAVIVITFLCLRPRQTLRCWPALFPMLILVHVAAPGALGSIEEGFFPKGGLIASQSGTYVGAGGQQVQATRLSRLGPQLHLFNEHNDPILGEGFGTRVIGRAVGVQDNAQVLDDQWLGTLLEEGVLGVFAWAWLFVLVIRRLARRAKLERDTPEGWLPVCLAASVAVFPAGMFTYDAFGFTQGTFVAFALIALSSIALWLPPVIARSERAGVPST